MLIMFSLIPSDANAPQGLMRRLAPNKQTKLSTIVLQLIIIIQTHHHHSFYFILQIFTFSIRIMFSLIPSDAYGPQRVEASLSTKQTINQTNYFSC